MLSRDERAGRACTGVPGWETICRRLCSSALVGAALLLTPAGASIAMAQDTTATADAMALATELFSAGSLAIGLTASGGQAYTYTAEDGSGGKTPFAVSDASRYSAGLEIRRMFGSVAAIALAGEYVMKPTNPSPLQDSFVGTLEIELFPVQLSGVMPYLGASLGLARTYWTDPSTDLGFYSTDFNTGFSAGAYMRIGRRMAAGAGYEYLMADSPAVTDPSTDYGAQGATLPDLERPAHGRIRVRLLFLL
jgi:hypothetical protein